MASELRVDTVYNEGGDNDSGLDMSTNDQVVLKTADTTALTVDANQNIAIGVTSKNSANNGSLTIGHTGMTKISASASGNADELVLIGADASANVGMSIISNNANQGTIFFGDEDDTDIGGIIYNHSDNSMSFQTNTNTDLKVTGAGLVEMGVSHGYAKLAVDSGTSDGYAGYFATNTAGGYAVMYLKTGSNVSNMMFFYRDSSVVGTITTNGSSVAFNTTSDYRLKENVVTDWDATSRLKQLKPSRFNFKADEDTTVDGFLAHEVSSIVPEAVTGEKDAVDKDGNIEPQGIDQSKLVPLLVKTIQELEARVAALEAK